MSSSELLFVVVIYRLIKKVIFCKTLTGFLLSINGRICARSPTVKINSNKHTHTHSHTHSEMFFLAVNSSGLYKHPRYLILLRKQICWFLYQGTSDTVWIFNFSKEYMWHVGIWSNDKSDFHCWIHLIKKNVELTLFSFIVF